MTSFYVAILALILFAAAVFVAFMVGASTIEAARDDDWMDLADVLQEPDERTVEDDFLLWRIENGWITT